MKPRKHASQNKRPSSSGTGRPRKKYSEQSKQEKKAIRKAAGPVDRKLRDAERGVRLHKLMADLGVGHRRHLDAQVELAQDEQQHAPRAVAAKAWYWCIVRQRQPSFP